MHRVVAWDAALIEWARSVIGEPFEWGRTDCASLARGAVLAMYEGAEPKVSVGPGWSTEKGALRAHARTGGVSSVLRRLGAEEVEPTCAQRGDFVLDGSREPPSVAVVVTNGVVGADPERGVFLSPMPLPTEDLQVLRLPHGG